MSEHHTPLVPPDCDLRDFQWMPVDIVRLFGSNFHANSNDSEWRAGVTLWLKSYHQVPAASLPDDDAALTMLAELGRDQKTWRKLRAKALRGWIKCSDGRLYHKTVAEKALEAWIDKLQQRKASAAGNAKRWGGDANVPAIERATEDAMDMLRTLNPNSKALAKRTKKGSQTETNGNADASSRDNDRDRGGSPESIPVGSQETRPEQNGLKKEDAAARGSVPSKVEFDRREQIMSDAARPMPVATCLDFSPMHQLISNGFSLELDILPAIEAAKADGKRFSTWDRLIGWVETANKTRQRAESAKPAPGTTTAPPAPLDLSPTGLMRIARVYAACGQYPYRDIAEPGTPGSPVTAEMVATARREAADEARRVISRNAEEAA